MVIGDKTKTNLRNREISCRRL